MGFGDLEERLELGEREGGRGERGFEGERVGREEVEVVAEEEGVGGGE